ncbi:hypothetical protein TNCV_3044421 [Trichonephila clavipes]|nr:hypothetical protein TNCV_3044421 [Trichonephila clavipes]
MVVERGKVRSVKETRPYSSVAQNPIEIVRIGNSTEAIKNTSQTLTSSTCFTLTSNENFVSTNSMNFVFPSRTPLNAAFIHNTVWSQIQHGCLKPISTEFQNRLVQTQTPIESFIAIETLV